eukprot:symbB.v1.2.021834.t1/scaffold1911.1/size96319/3
MKTNNNALVRFTSKASMGYQGAVILVALASVVEGLAEPFVVLTLAVLSQCVSAAARLLDQFLKNPRVTDFPIAMVVMQMARPTASFQPSPFPSFHGTSVTYSSQSVGGGYTVSGGSLKSQVSHTSKPAPLPRSFVPPSKTGPVPSQASTQAATAPTRSFVPQTRETGQVSSQAAGQAPPRPVVPPPQETGGQVSSQAAGQAPPRPVVPPPQETGGQVSSQAVGQAPPRPVVPPPQETGGQVSSQAAGQAPPRPVVPPPQETGGQASSQAVGQAPPRPAVFLPETVVRSQVPGSCKEDPQLDAANPFDAESVVESEPSAAKTDLATIKVKVNEDGKPVIVRSQDASGPKGVRTIITHEDGTCRAFGEAIVTSLLGHGQMEVLAWLSSMDPRSLRGLVNELSERFFEIQQRLCDCKAELEEKRRFRGLSMFNLDGDCTEKDLDVAYRKLARTMHPDKNGGTEEAKEQFQTMRASYEELKEQFEQGQIGKTSPKATSGPDVTQEDENSPETPREDPEAVQAAESAEDGSDKSPEEPKSNAAGQSNVGSGASGQAPIFFCRSEDLSALQSAACKILEKMKILQQNVAMVERDLAGV